MERDQILELMKHVDGDFSPPLSQKVDLDAYVTKIIQNAVLLQVADRGTLTALLAMYCNDPDCRVAYVTMVAVDTPARGRGLAKSLVRMAIEYAKAAGFRKLSLEVYRTNRTALELYRRLGFAVAAETPGSLILEFTLETAGPRG